MVSRGRTRALWIVVTVTFVVVGTASAGGLDMERYIRLYERSRPKATGKGDQEKQAAKFLNSTLDECRKRLAKVIARYGATGVKTDFRTDPDVNFLINDRFPAVYLICLKAQKDETVRNSPLLRSVMVYMISGIGWNGAVDSVRSLFSEASTTDELAAMCRTIGLLGGRRALTSLESFLREHATTADEGVIATCCLSLSSLVGRRDEKTAVRLREQFVALASRMKDPTAKARVGLALFRLGVEDHIASALSVMSDPKTSSAVRLELIGFFKSNFCEQAISVLAGIAGEDDAVAADNALEALASMTRYGEYDFEPKKPLPPNETQAEEEKGEGAETAQTPPRPQPVTPAQRREQAARIVAWWEQYKGKIQEREKEARRVRWKE